MLPAWQRVRRPDEFRRARRGARVSTTLMVVSLAAGEDPGPARAGFVVSREVGNAVTRNRLRRQLRHLLMRRLDSLSPGSLLVVRLKAAAGGSSTSSLAHDLDTVLPRLVRRTAR